MCWSGQPEECLFFIVQKSADSIVLNPQFWCFTWDEIAVSVAVLAELSLRSPRKLFIFIIKKIYLSDQSIQKLINLILKKSPLIAVSDVPALCTDAQFYDHAAHQLEMTNTICVFSVCVSGHVVTQ